MNILRINSWDGPAVGGAEVYVRRVSEALDARGHHNVSVALVSDPPPESVGPIQTFRMPRSAAMRMITEVTESSRLTRWLDGVADEAKPDIIHLHRFHSGFPALGPWLGRRPEPIVFTAHDAQLVCPIATLTLPDGTACPGGILPRCQLTGCEVGMGLPWNLAKRRSFDTWVKDRVRSYICTSRATQGVFENLGYRPTALLRPMIPVPAEPAAIPTGPFTIGFLGRLERQKGVEVLLAAYEEIRRKRSDVRLRFAGAGPVPIPQRDGISSDGWVADSHRWFGSVHVLAAPSLPWENLGNSSVEALANGVPAVVSDTGGLPETVGRFGTVVPAGDPVALATGLLDVIDGYAEARQHALAGRVWVGEEFSTERHLERLLAIYAAAGRTTSGS